ncbi:hypothetical protein ElyMa_004812700 [Elysia marginata]|uniref:Uncharacterized protein n=1 Tax=Elysia marginata TaxID=1093978 RepID=A0AAV4IKA5_9GAST|nr:hypothetical protein ElyMa_004812700 [Elysia marginata]
MFLLVDYHIQKWHRSLSLQRCVSRSDLLYRLLIVFQLNGYIPLEIPTPKTVTPNLPHSSMFHKLNFEKLEGLCNFENNVNVSMCVEAVHGDFKRLRGEFTDSELSQEKWLALREKHVEDAFNAVPSWIREKVIAAFHRDFLLFGYHVPTID